MTKFLKYLAPLLLLVLVPVVASADLFQDAVSISDELNTVKFFNRETYIRAVGDSWERVSSNDVDVNDYLVSIFSATQLYLADNPSAAWSAKPGDYLLGYSLMQVVGKEESNGKVLGYSFGNAGGWDPFGKLATGETMVLYTNSNNWNPNLGIEDSIATIGGTRWASFNIADGGDDFAQVGISYIGMNPVGRIASYGMSAVDLPAGVSLNADDYLSIGKLTEMAATASIFKNSDANSPWEFISSDPMFFRAVPEPGTLTLFAGCLAIGGVIALRRRKK